MKITKSTNSYSYEVGFYATNWGYPIENEWGIGIHFFKWNLGLELKKRTKEST